MTTERPSHVDAVERYYARNTKAFLRLGDNEGVPAIHIALWPDGVDTVADAMQVAHRLILDTIQSQPLKRVADLGCGMGAALAYLDAHLPHDVELHGLTLGTPVLARGDDSRIHIQHGDFHRSDETLPTCSAAFCIDAIAHAHDPEQFFAAAGRLLEPGGRLLVMDDVVMHNKAASKHLDTYRAHWLAPGVQPLDSLVHWANAAGLSLENNRDLTPWIRLGRPRDRLIRWTRPLWAWMTRFSEYAKSLSGGDARQRCLETGETNFRLLVFVRS